LAYREQSPSESDSRLSDRSKSKGLTCSYSPVSGVPSLCSVVLSANVKRSLRGRVKIWLKGINLLVKRERLAVELREEASPIYVEGKLYVTCVRLGHDTRNLVKLLALMTCKCEIVIWRKAGVRASEGQDRSRALRCCINFFFVGGEGEWRTRSSMPVTLNMSSYLNSAVTALSSRVSQGCACVLERARHRSADEWQTAGGSAASEICR
jgi:hypothetical protein